MTKYILHTSIPAYPMSRPFSAIFAPGKRFPQLFICGLSKQKHKQKRGINLGTSGKQLIMLPTEHL
jgi:hypothetical protein